jgi:hypothetical protein
MNPMDTLQPVFEPAAANATVLPPRRRRVDPWVPAFVVFELLCAVALLVPDLAQARMALRVATFGASLGLLVVLRGRGGRHPAWIFAVMAMLVVGVQVFNPDTSNLVAGSAQAALYLAVMGPLFWLPRLDLDIRVVRRVAFILWGFHTLSAALGVIQVYFPGQFQPNVSSIIAGRRDYMETLMIMTSGGVKVYRPMGLTDIPGGAAISGLYAMLFGTGFFLTRRTPWMMGAAALSMVLGTTCLYLSQVRAVLVMTGIAVVAMCAILVWRRDIARLGTLAGAAGAVAVTGYSLAMWLAGPAVATRVGSLVARRPGSVYYNERGHFFYDALVRILPEHPFGMGLGHWGMMATYFGRPGDAGANNAVWVELQWVGWIVDGGALLAIAYFLALAAALWAVWKVARAKAPPGAPDLPFWGTVVLAHGIGALALTFSYPIFLSQPGMEFWLLNALLFTAARHEYRRAKAARAATPPVALAA